MCLWLKAHFEHDVCLKTTNGKFMWSFPIARHEQKQQRKHNLTIKITFIQHLTYVKVISIDDLFVYTTIGAFTKANPHHYLQDRHFARKLFGCHLCVSHLLSTSQRARINFISFIKNDGAWSKLQNFIEPDYKQLIACFVRDFWH